MGNYFVYGFVEADDEEKARFKSTVEGGNDILKVEKVTLDEVSHILELASGMLNELSETERKELIKHYFKGE